MRWQVVPQVAACTHVACWRRHLPQLCQFAQQMVYLLLLAHDDAVQLVQLVFREAGFDFQRGEPLFGVV